MRVPTLVIIYICICAYIQVPSLRIICMHLCIHESSRSYYYIYASVHIYEFPLFVSYLYICVYIRVPAHTIIYMHLCIYKIFQPYCNICAFVHI